jgi:arginine-tRNA-protein transferase
VYKIDGKTIGISVIDILPTCVSSVYFIWDPEYAWASLGKLSALFEVAIAIDIQKAGVQQLKWLYMGKLATAYLVSSSKLIPRILDSELRQDAV